MRVTGKEGRDLGGVTALRTSWPCLARPRAALARVRPAGGGAPLAARRRRVPSSRAPSLPAPFSALLLKLPAPSRSPGRGVARTAPPLPTGDHGAPGTPERPEASWPYCTGPELSGFAAAVLATFVAAAAAAPTAGASGCLRSDGALPPAPAPESRCAGHQASVRGTHRVRRSQGSAGTRIGAQRPESRSGFCFGSQH